MAINIAEQFNVNTPKPIDSRIVASNLSERNAIGFKYDGLMVYDKSDKKIYIWQGDQITGTWSKPIESLPQGLGSISGDLENYIVKYSTSSGSGFDKSEIYIIRDSLIDDNWSRVGINTTQPKGILDIRYDRYDMPPLIIEKTSDANIIASNWYLDANQDATFRTEYGSSLLSMNIAGEFILYIRSQNNLNALDSSDNPSNPSIIAKFSHENIFFKKRLVFIQSDYNTGFAAMIRSQNSSSPTTPDFTWWNNDQTGMYRPSQDVIGFTTGGVQKTSITVDGVNIFGNLTVYGLHYGIVPIGTIVIFSGNGPIPIGWLLCDGGLYNKTTLNLLFTAIGSLYGESGDSFRVPNLKGRVVVGQDTSQSEFNILGETGGSKTHELTRAQLPKHQHLIGSGDGAAMTDPGAHTHTIDNVDSYILFDNVKINGDLVADINLGQGTVTSNGAGSHIHTGRTGDGTFNDFNEFNPNGTKGGLNGEAHNNLQPYIALRYIIYAGASSF